MYRILCRLKCALEFFYQTVYSQEDKVELSGMGPSLYFTLYACEAPKSAVTLNLLSTRILFKYAKIDT